MRLGLEDITAIYRIMSLAEDANVRNDIQSPSNGDDISSREVCTLLYCITLCVYKQVYFHNSSNKRYMVDMTDKLAAMAMHNDVNLAACVRR